jgi:hypothetical protein
MEPGVRDVSVICVLSQVEFVIWSNKYPRGNPSIPAKSLDLTAISGLIDTTTTLGACAAGASVARNSASTNQYSGARNLKVA